MFAVRETPAFSQWLADLADARAKYRILARIVRLEAGLFGDVKSVGAGVSEIRVDEGPGYRVYYTQRGKQIILLLLGGDKSRQGQDIAAAQEMVEKLDEDEKKAAKEAEKAKSRKGKK